MVHSCTCETLLRKRYDNINCIIFTAGIYDNILSSSFATPIRPSCMLSPVKLAAPVIVLSALECSKESSPHSICFGVSIHYIFIHNRILVQDRAMWFIAACHVLNSFLCLYLTCAPPLQTILCRPAVFCCGFFSCCSFVFLFIRADTGGRVANVIMGEILLCRTWCRVLHRNP